MNSDHILEVPDTPDRIQQSTCPVSSSVSRRDFAMAAANPFPRRRIIFKAGNSSMHSPSSHGNACSVPAPSDADLFKQAEVARVLKLSEDLEEKLSSQSFNRTTGTSSENEMRDEKHGLDQSSSTLNHISCSDTGGRSLSCQIRDVEVSQRDANHLNANFLGVGSGLPTIPVAKPRNRIGISTINRPKVVAGADVCPASSSREVKGETITNKAVAGPLSAPYVVPQRHVGQKKLVRNGCISPSNIAKRSVKVDGKQVMCSPSGVLHHPHPQLDVSGKGNVIDLTDNLPLTTRQESTVNARLISANNMDTRATKRLRTDRAGKTSIPLSEYHANSSNNSGLSLSGRNNKEKEICYDFLDSMRIGEGDTRRVCPSTGSFPSVVNNCSSSMNPEQGWRKKHNHTSKLPISSMGSRQESGPSAPSDQDHVSAAGGNKNLISGATTTWPVSLGNKTLGIVRARRKPASSSSHPGESYNAFNEPRGSFLASSRTTAARNHTTRRHDIPIITIDDVFPETRPSSSGYDNGTSVDPTIQAQLEADELLARQLQEQLYNESPRVIPTEEKDAVIAMSLQHEEDAHRTSRAARQSQYNTRGAQAPRSQASHSNAYQNAVERTNNLIFHLQNAASTTLGLGTIFPRYPGGPHIQPNIDLNDYDALLALDENNHQHTGASECQINNLPSNSTKEPCAVCLENPSVGDTIRHLPCFHKFHKECIDEWLRRKKLCPICKSGIR